MRLDRLVSSTRVRQLARRTARRLPPRVRAALRPAVGVVRRLVPGLAQGGDQAGKPKAPLLSVVVAVPGPAEQPPELAASLDACLESLRTQTLSRLEVLVVCDDTLPEVLATADRHAAEDDRVRCIRRRFAGLSSARNAGTDQARGSYLAFLVPTDTVPAAAYAALVKSLRRTGSDFAAGCTAEVWQGRTRRPAWAPVTHELDRPSRTVDDFPLVLQDPDLTGRVFRRSLWRGVVGGLPAGSDYGENFAVVLASLRAQTFDLLRLTSCLHHPRLPPGRLTHEHLNVDELSDRRSWWEATWDQVSAEATPAVAGVWLGRLIDQDLGDVAEDAGRALPEYRQQLQALAARCLAAADETVWTHVRVQRKLRLWLSAQGRWEDLELLIAQFRSYGAMPATRVGDGRVEAIPELLPGVADAPVDCLELGQAETVLSGCVERGRWQGSVLELEGWAFIRGIDLTEIVPEITAALRETTTGVTLPVDLVPACRSEANRWARLRYQDVAPAAFALRLDVDAVLPLLQAGGSLGGPVSWQLVLTVTAGGVQRSGPLTAVVAEGGARRIPARDLATQDDPLRVVPLLDPSLGFCLQLRPEVVRAVSLEVGERGVVAGALRVLRPGLKLAAVTAVAGPHRLRAPLVQADAHAHFELALPVGDEVSDWEFRAVDVAGREHRVSWPVEGDVGRRVGGGQDRAGWRRSVRGYCELLTNWTAAEVEDVDVDSDQIAVVLQLLNVSEAECWTARLVGPLVEVPVTSVEPLPDAAGRVGADGPRVRVTFALRARRWGGPEMPLPKGEYQIGYGSRDAQVVVSEELLSRCPLGGRTASHAYEVGRRRNQVDLLLRLSSPLAEDERSRCGSQRLAEQYQEAEYTPRDAVLFQCYRGDFATDSQRAIHEELRRRGTTLELLWGVTDTSVPVPEGGQPLLMGSRAWYEALGSARYLCQNIDYDRFFRKRPYQRYLQTFHGYPFKSMGASLWRAQGRSEPVIAHESQRRSAVWDAIVVPEEFCVELYRREYSYSGEVLVTGYPRNDGLVTADAAQVRARVLATLGIDPSRTVVLYAPTWRDTVATSPWTATFFDALDLDALAAQLGEDYVVLLRGHNYNLREGMSAPAGAVVDVTSYPEVNDLVLASDAAVLDYSSLRFDWLLTGKPVLFFVPDLADYLSARRALFDYAETAPGPLLATTAEAGAAILDLPAVSARYAAAREAFNVRFNRLHDGHATARVVDAFFG